MLAVPVLPCCAVHTATAWASTVRLVNGSTANQGRVEVLHQGTWVPLCSSGFGRRAAAIVCRQLGWVGGPATLEPAGAFGGWPGGVSRAAIIRGQSGDASCSDIASDTLYSCPGLTIATPASMCATACVTCSSSKGAWWQRVGLWVGQNSRPSTLLRCRHSNRLCSHVVA